MCLKSTKRFTFAVGFLIMGLWNFGIIALKFGPFILVLLQSDWGNVNRFISIVESILVYYVLYTSIEIDPWFVEF